MGDEAPPFYGELTGMTLPKKPTKPEPVRTPRVDWVDDEGWNPLPDRSTSTFRAGHDAPGAGSSSAAATRQ